MIVRTPTKASGGITDAERKEMGKLVEKYTKLAFSTQKEIPTNRKEIVENVKLLYKAAGLECERVSVVQSPRMMAHVFGIGAAWHYIRGKGGKGLPKVEPKIKTLSTAEDAVMAATFAAVMDVTCGDERDSGDNNAFVNPDPIAASLSDGGKIFSSVAERFLQKKDIAFAKECAKRWWNCYQGGNMWAGFLCYADAMKNVIGLTGLSCWRKFEPYKRLGEISGFRCLHEKFCVVSELPIEYHVINASGRNVLHRDGGPAALWRDGFAMWYLNGIRVPREIVMTPTEKLDPKIVLAEKNTDVQREIIRKIGIERVLKALKAKEVDSFESKVKKRDGSLKTCVYKLLVLDAGEGSDYSGKYLYYNHFNIGDSEALSGVYYAKMVPPSCNSALEALAWMYSIIEEKYFTLDESEKDRDALIKALPTVAC